VNDDGKELDKCREYFFSIPYHMTHYVFIFTHCNTNIILTLIVMNNITKELVMIATQHKSNHSKSKHNIHHHHHHQ